MSSTAAGLRHVKHSCRHTSCQAQLQACFMSSTAAGMRHVKHTCRHTSCHAQLQACVMSSTAAGIRHVKAQLQACVMSCTTAGIRHVKRSCRHTSCQAQLQASTANDNGDKDADNHSTDSKPCYAMTTNYPSSRILEITKIRFTSQLSWKRMATGVVSKIYTTFTLNDILS